MRKLILLSAMLTLPVLASAADVYKCKGSKGEIIYQDVSCPNDAMAIATGHYDLAPDDPIQTVAAAREAERIHDAREQQQRAAEQQVSQIEQVEQSRNAALVRGKLAAAKAKGEQEMRESARRWGTGVVARNDDRDSSRMNAAQKTPPETVSCSGGAAGSVNCFNSDGTMSYGHRNSNGSGVLYNDDGSSENLSRDGSGHTKTESGICVRNIYGECQ